MTQPLRQCVANLAFYGSIFGVNAPREILFSRVQTSRCHKSGSVTDMAAIAVDGLVSAQGPGPWAPSESPVCVCFSFVCLRGCYPLHSLSPPPAFVFSG